LYINIHVDLEYVPIDPDVRKLLVWCGEGVASGRMKRYRGDADAFSCLFDE